MSGPIRPPLKVEEQDGNPSVRPVNTIKVTNGTLTDDGGAGAEQVSVTEQITVYDPDKIDLLVDFGGSGQGNQFEWTDWDTVIKDTYAKYTSAGPGGLYQKGAAAARRVEYPDFVQPLLELVQPSAVF